MANRAIELPSPPPFDPDAIPDAATLSRGGTALRLIWRDGLSATLPAEHLRLRCRCAWCTRDRVVDRFPDAFANIAVTRVEPMGGYAVHIAFTDGHARGIFPWAYLRALAAEAIDSPAAAAQAA
jgi:prepilin-type processing-associated H-X9-DG protein